MVACIDDRIQKGEVIRMNHDSKKIFDISMPISSDMPVYKGKESKKPVIAVESDHNTGTSYESSIKMNLHTGTH